MREEIDGQLRLGFEMRESYEFPVVVDFGTDPDISGPSAGLMFSVGFGSAIRSGRLRVSTGREAMIGASAVALEDFAKRGNVRAFSENWQARSAHPVRKGDKLRVTGIEGLVLTVAADGDMSARAGATDGTVVEE